MYNIVTIKHIDDEFIKEWKELWESAKNANIYNSYEYFLTSLEISHNKNYKIYVCYKDKKLVALLPLQKYKCFGIGVWGTINKDHLVDTPFLMKKYDRNLFESFFSQIFAEGNVYIQKVDDGASELLHKIYPNTLFSLISVNPLVPLDGDPFVSASQSTIKLLRKIIRKNEGHLRFEMHNTNLPKHMQTLLNFQKSTSKSKRSMDIFADKETKTYYVNLAKNASQIVWICFLYLDDILIAYQYGFLYRNIFVGDQIAYHDDYKKIRAGKLMVYYIIEELKKLGKVKLLDQGGGISSYKMEFSSEYRLLYNIYYSRNIFVMMWWKMINKTRRIKQILSPRKYTRDHEFLFKTL
jgi:hypothetical protein